MNTATASSATLKTDSILRRKALAFLAQLRLALEYTGRAHMNGAKPL